MEWAMIKKNADRIMSLLLLLTVSLFAHAVLVG
jgi:hypothetical protein